MGIELLHFYQNKVDRRWKIAFLSTFLIGLFVHMYKFTNTLPNHDSLGNYYSSQNVLGSGRWFLSIACGVSSYFDLPWVIGIFSLALIAVTTVIVITIFDVKNPVLIALIGALLVCFPAVAQIFFYEYTADGYMIAMVLAALTVQLSRVGDDSKLHGALSACLLCLCCAIYQAYVSFALVLALLYFMWELLENRHEQKAYTRWVRRQLVIYPVGLACYFAIWKLLMFMRPDVQVTKHQDIEHLGSITVSTILDAASSSIRTLIHFFAGSEEGRASSALYCGLNILFLICTVAIIVIAVYKSDIWKHPLRMSLFLLCMIALPFAACIWQFTSQGVIYRMRMLHSLCVLYIFATILFERYLSAKWSNLTGMLLAVIILNYGIQANIAYYHLNDCYESTYAMGTEMIARVHMLDTESQKIAVIGNRYDEVRLNNTAQPNPSPFLSQPLETDLLYDQKHVVRFLNHTFHCDLNAVTPEERRRLINTDAVMEMGAWPASDSVQVIDDTIVIKL